MPTGTVLLLSSEKIVYPAHRIFYEEKTFANLSPALHGDEALDSEGRASYYIEPFCWPQ